ncbi:MAG: M50 family metallopeptidase [Gammaproteobacteria bacterium]|nr:M50 family metallopeptidase [Gammaproteobacteria bacterium]
MKQILIIAGLMAAIFLLWNYPVLYPLKLLVVFFHESSHALMTVATGGSVETLVIDPMQGGHVISVGGDRFLTLSAGYLGSLVWGVVIYLIAVRTRLDKAMMILLGVIVIAIAVFFIREMFALAFAGVTGVILILMGWKLPMEVNDLVLRVIGMTNMIYVPYDIYSDTIARSELASDAFMLAEEFGGATWLWGGVWLVVSLVLVVITLVVGLSVGSDEPSSDEDVAV